MLKPIKLASKVQDTFAIKKDIYKFHHSGRLILCGSCCVDGKEGSGSQKKELRRSILQSIMFPFGRKLYPKWCFHFHAKNINITPQLCDFCGEIGAQIFNAPMIVVISHSLQK